MKDDFFNQFQEPPRPEFAEELYERINLPMKAQAKPLAFRRIALAFTFLIMLAALSLAVSPTMQAQAQALLRQIGVFLITNEVPKISVPTALPPDQSNPPAHYASADETEKAARFNVLEPGELPQGYIQYGDYTLSVMGNGLLVASSYVLPGSSEFVLLNQYKAGQGDIYTDNISPGEQTQEVRVRDKSGLWISGRLMTNPLDPGISSTEELQATQWLRWEEQGVTYTVISNSPSLEDALQFANSLR
jgi:hypothetical protein